VFVLLSGYIQRASYPPHNKQDQNICKLVGCPLSALYLDMWEMCLQIGTWSVHGRLQLEKELLAGYARITMNTETNEKQRCSCAGKSSLKINHISKFQISSNKIIS
jgi:hypothetical protein